MKAMDDYLAAKQAIFEHVGYVEDWVAIPLDDCRQMYWHISDGEGVGGQVHYAPTEEGHDNESGNYYQDEIYTQRFLPKWVYRGAEYTAVCCNPGVDGNKFLRIFTNANERSAP